jgi:hypothetical protein
VRAQWWRLRHRDALAFEISRKFAASESLQPAHPRPYLFAGIGIGHHESAILA